MAVEIRDVRLSLDHCVKCNICNTVCPVSNVTPLFPGPKYVGPQAERFRQGGASPDASLDYCSGCGICTQVCPHGVKIAEINAKARAAMYAGRIPLRNKILARPELLGKIARPIAPLANLALGLRPVRWLMALALGILAFWFMRWRPNAGTMFGGLFSFFFLSIGVYDLRRDLIRLRKSFGLSPGTRENLKSLALRVMMKLAPAVCAAAACSASAVMARIMMKRMLRCSRTSVNSACDQCEGRQGVKLRVWAR